MNRSFPDLDPMPPAGTNFEIAPGGRLPETCAHGARMKRNKTLTGASPATPTSPPLGAGILMSEIRATLMKLRCDRSPDRPQQSQHGIESEPVRVKLSFSCLHSSAYLDSATSWREFVATTYPIMVYVN